MIYREFTSAKLQKWVKCFWTLTQRSRINFDPEPILPDGSPEIVFNLAGPFRRYHKGTVERQPESIVVGQMNSFVVIEPTNLVDLFGIRFHPHGLYPLVRQSMTQLSDQIESVETVFGKKGSQLEERIKEAKSTEERIKICEEEFSDSLFVEFKDGDLVEYATRSIANNDFESIGQLAVKLDISNKKLERIFNRYVGITAKRLSRITRLQKVVTKIGGKQTVGWADLAYSFGYFDQSHFIKDFKDFSGLTPKAFKNWDRSLTDYFIS